MTRRRASDSGCPWRHASRGYRGNPRESADRIVLEMFAEVPTLSLRVAAATETVASWSSCAFDRQASRRSRVAVTSITLSLTWPLKARWAIGCSASSISRADECSERSRIRRCSPAPPTGWMACCRSTLMARHSRLHHGRAVGCSNWTSGVGPLPLRSSTARGPVRTRASSVSMSCSPGRRAPVNSFTAHP